MKNRNGKYTEKLFKGRPKAPDVRGRAILTIVLKNTEEKWLLDLYGEEYARYKKHVNRCIPWFPKQESDKDL